MKTAITYMLMVIGLFAIGWETAKHKMGTQPQHERIVLQHPTRVEMRTIEDLLDAIEWVESKGATNAVGDNGRAVGAYQIHPCYVEDIGWGWSGGERLSDDDRYDRDKSREMVKRYLSHYATYRRLNRYPTLEDMARIHNGGPDGWEKESTLPYWERIQKVLDK
jgi:hypothetical protein